MFTIGIFSAHIPYIALVLFYAYVLLFNVQKTEGDNADKSERSAFLTEIQVEKHTVDQQSSNHAYYCEGIVAADFESCIFSRKIKHKWKDTPPFHHAEFYISLFYRPPPVLG